ncbi:hypothetical protein FB451DRAFT_1290174, partial [Mycena latifolia]
MSFFTPFYLSFWAGTGTLLYAFCQKNENLLYNLLNKRALYLSFSIPFFRYSFARPSLPLTLDMARLQAALWLAAPAGSKPVLARHA